MKLRNKKTGEIKDFQRVSGEYIALKPNIVSSKDYTYSSLAELNEDWEDYEDELLYIISAEHKSGYQCVLKEDYPEICKVAKELGIGFETEEAAEKAVEKLKAWKRLKDKGFRFRGLGVDNYEIDDIKYEMKEPPITHDCQEMKDLKLLFGGKDEQNRKLFN